MAVTAYDCEGCGAHVLQTGRDGVPRSQLCAVCEWLCEHVTPEEMMEIRAHSGLIDTEVSPLVAKFRRLRAMNDSWRFAVCGHAIAAQDVSPTQPELDPPDWPGVAIERCPEMHPGPIKAIRCDRRWRSVAEWSDLAQT